MARSLAWYHERCVPFAREVAGELRKGLTNSEVYLLNSIRIECRLDPGFGAAAGIIEGKPVIRIATGTIASLEESATASALGSAYGKPLCGPLYMEAMAAAGQENFQRMIQRLPLKSFLSPFEFAQTEKEYCPQVSEATFRANQSAAEGREILINAGLRFILAHELGHHVLGHVLGAPGSAAQSRERERDADAFALRVVTRAGRSPLDSILALGLLASFDDYSQRNSATATHPSGKARLAILEEAFKSISKEPGFQAWLREDPERPYRWKKAVDAFSQMARDFEP